MILVIDNYDSFVKNLARYFEQLGCRTVVVRNDRITASEIGLLKPEAIVLSPGPCSPDEAGVCLEVVERFAGSIPILGICLGHQAIAQALGSRVVRANEPMHGRPSEILHCGSPMFAGVPTPFIVGRYHSLVVERQSLSSDLRITATTSDRTIMALEHQRWPIVGLQFHPESILTECGYQLLANFLQIASIDFDSDRAATLAAQVPNRRAAQQTKLSPRLSTQSIDGPIKELQTPSNRSLRPS